METDSLKVMTKAWEGWGGCLQKGWPMEAKLELDKNDKICVLLHRYQSCTPYSVQKSEESVLNASLEKKYWQAFEEVGMFNH